MEEDSRNEIMILRREIDALNDAIYQPSQKQIPDELRRQVERKEARMRELYSKAEN